MSLPVELDQEFWSEFRHFEEEQKMPYLTSIERIGIQQGQAETVLLLLKHKFSSLSEEVETQIQQLDSPQLTQLSEALLDFQQLQELINWLKNTQ